LERYEMFSILKSGDVNILIAYFGVDISGRPVTDGFFVALAGRILLELVEIMTK
jgi:hypothetical protein